MTTTFKEQIISTLNDKINTLSEGEAKQNSLEFIEKNDFPNKKREDWRKTDLAKLFKHKYSKSEQVDVNQFIVSIYKVRELEANLLVFVNGYLLPEYSNIISKNLIIKNIAKAKLENKDVFNQYFNKTDIQTDNLFSAINTAYAEDGIFINIPRNKTVEHPVHVLFLSDGNNKKSVSQIRNLIVADENSEAKIIFSYHSISVNYTVNNIATEIFANKDSRLNFNVFQGEGDDAIQFNNTKIEQFAGSNFSSNYITLCGAIVRNDLKVLHKDENCETNLNGLYLPDREQHFDNSIFIHHAKPNCNSTQLYRGIVDNKATAVFSGKVLVAKDAQKTNAEQNNNNILLNQYAKAHSKPQLEIYADDVKCSHGSTTGQLDKEALFYLQSRGIGFKEARILLLNAFANEVIDKITIPEFRRFVKFLIEKRMSGDKLEGQCAMFEECGGC